MAYAFATFLQYLQCPLFYFYLLYPQLLIPPHVEKHAFPQFLLLLICLLVLSDVDSMFIYGMEVYIREVR